MPVPAQQPQIRQQRTVKEFALRQHMERSSVAGRVKPPHGQIALDARLSQPVRRFHFNQPLPAVPHSDQKVGDDMAESQSAAAATHGWPFGQQLNLQSSS